MNWGPSVFLVVSSACCNTLHTTGIEELLLNGRAKGSQHRPCDLGLSSLGEAEGLCDLCLVALLAWSLFLSFTAALRRRR